MDILKYAKATSQGRLAKHPTTWKAARHNTLVKALTAVVGIMLLPTHVSAIPEIGLSKIEPVVNGLQKFKHC
jgi:hypothetical protein